MNVREYARKVSVPFIYVCFYKFVFHKNCFLLFSSKMKHKKRAKLSQKKKKHYSVFKINSQFVILNSWID